MKENTKYTDTSKCPTQKALEQYVFSELNSAEQYHIERHLLHCKICDDVVEGLMILKDEKKLVAATQNINKKIDAKVGITKNNHRTFLAIAAGLALLVGLTFYFTNSNQQQLASNNKKENTEPEIVKQDSNSTEIARETEDVNQQKEEDIVTLKPTTTKQLASDFKSERKTKTPIAENVSNDIVYETMAGNTETPVQFSAPVAAMPKQTTDIQEDLSSTKAISDDAKPEAKVKEVAAITTGDNSIKNPQSKNNSNNNATTQTNVTATIVQPIEQNISHDEINIEETKSRKLDSFMNDKLISQTNYNGGVKYYEQKKYEKAIKNLDVVLQYPKTNFYEDALFLKAKCLIGLEKKEEAKALLQSIVKQNGKHKQEAETLQLTIDN